MARIVALTEEARQIIAGALADYIKHSEIRPDWQGDREHTRALELARVLLVEVLRGEVYIEPPREAAPATPPAPKPDRHWLLSRFWKQ